LHVFDKPLDGKLILHGIANEPSSAWLLTDSAKSSLPIEQKEDALILSLPEKLPDPIITVIVLDLKGKPNIDLPPAIESKYDIFIAETKVNLSSSSTGAAIRYTLDGSVPDEKSPVFKEPIAISNTTTITARTFRNGIPVTEAIRKTFTKVKPQPAEPGVVAAPGLQYLYYEGIWDSLPDFGKLKPLKTGIVKNFDRSAKNKDGEHYAFEFNGYIQVPAEAIYRFSISSDDGSQLWVDGKLLVNNDGLHGMQEKSGLVALAAGYHELWVRYFEKTGSDDLRLSWESERMEKQALPNAVLFYVQPK
jgi:alpha-L-fucosidase